ncbi:MAG: xanthine dehydrogenase family protein molybdopterin-binding subunit [Rhodobacterales bacterium]|nr:xanthine dehydrogenase family protein molybdopterin-binding subunit [Rhodobacterales bacterium]
MNVPKIGDPVKRIDGRAKASGNCIYPSDFVPSGCLFLRLLHSEFAHANIAGIDTTAAAAISGVVGIFTAMDVPGLNLVGVPGRDFDRGLEADTPVLCGERVRSRADVIAIVAAESDEIARAALGLIKVTYDVLPAVFDPREAMAANAPMIHHYGNVLHQIHHTAGDVDAAMAGAEEIVEASFVTGRQEHLPLETEAGVAYYDELGNLTIRHGGQHPHRDAVEIARFLGIEADSIRVQTPMVGGAFGGKDDFVIQCHVALVTFLTKRPTYIMLDRAESIATTPKRHPYHNSCRIACDAQGKFLAATVSLISDTGAYGGWGEAVLHVTAETCLGPYYFPNVKIDGFAVHTNNCTSGAFRGFGGLQGTLGIELMIDELARRLNIDPFTIRKINALQPGQPAPGGFAFNADSSSLDLVLDRISDSDLYRNGLREKQDGSVDKPWLRRGIGVAACWMGTGLSNAVPDSCEAAVQLLESGSYRVLMGGVDMGQGNATAFCQIVATEMNCPMAMVDIQIGDSWGPNSGPCDAVRSMAIMGKALQKAIVDLTFQIKTAIAAKLSCLADDVILNGGVGLVRGSNKSVELCSLGNMTGRGLLKINQADPSRNTDDMSKCIFSYGAQVALVEVDTLTGRVDVLKMTSAIDAGRVVNRQGFEAQSEGGIVQGIGFALSEDCLMRDGQVLNTGLSTYVAPYVFDVPDEIVTLAVENPDPQTPYGVKGIAEIVMLPTPPAILNAVRDAVGVRYTSTPLMPEHVLAGLSDANRPSNK